MTRRRGRRAWAPGKIVLSGAYAVLEGAPAIVAAVDRYAHVDPARDAELVTDEVRAAIELGLLGRAPSFDASELRVVNGTATRKLGLGSSAAVLVASLGAQWVGVGGDQAAREAVLGAALTAHRHAQRGGSGIDVAASVHGGVLRFLRTSDPLRPELTSHELPAGLVIDIFASDRAASTMELRARVDALRNSSNAAYHDVMHRVERGAVAAAAATSVSAFVAAIAIQIDALDELGARAGAPIVTREVAALRPLALSEGATFGPSGAGGGDIALFVGGAPSSTAFRRAAGAAGMSLLTARAGARGLHVEASEHDRG